MEQLPKTKHEQESKIEGKEKKHTLSVGYLMGLWDLPREQVLEKILKEKLPYEIEDGQIAVLSDAVPVGGK